MHATPHPLFRPPGEADSLILRVADGCPWNRCLFCGMYKGVPYRFAGLDAATALIRQAARRHPATRRIFLADGDVMHLEQAPLEELLRCLNAAFPRLVRVGLYANGASILAKSDSQLHRLRELKLHTLYMGLESGSSEVLQAMHKRETPESMATAGQRAQHAGLRMSVMILLGLGGRHLQAGHVRDTAATLNRMQPRLLSALRVVPVPGTPLAAQAAAGTFDVLSEREIVAELREMIERLDLESTIFRANHASNVLPIEARFPKDKQRVLEQLDRALASGHLDPHTPGPLPFWL